MIATLWDSTTHGSNTRRNLEIETLGCSKSKEKEGRDRNKWSCCSEDEVKPAFAGSIGFGIGIGFAREVTQR